MSDDLKDMRARLSALLLAQHNDARSLKDIKRAHTARAREIDALSDEIERLEDETGDYGC